MRNKDMAFGAAVVLALALALPLAACGSQSEQADSAAEDKGTYSAGGNSYAADDDYYGYAAGEMPDFEPTISPMEMDEGVASPVSGLAANLVTTGVPSAMESQKLVYTASVSIDTTGFQDTLGALRALAEGCGAFAEAEEEWVFGSQELHAIHMVLRVPAEHYEELMAGMDGIGGTVTKRSSQVTNITRTYADNEAVIEGLEIQEQRLLEMMGQAQTIEDMIMVEERLSNVQTQLNRARTSRSSMDADVSLSTVTVTVNEVRFSTATSKTGYFTRLANAFADMWDSFVEGVGDFFIGVVYAIPALVILAALVLLGRKGVRHLLSKKRGAAKTGEAVEVEGAIGGDEGAGPAI